MNETLEDFIHGYGFPLATEIGKLGLLYLTIEPGNVDLFDKYLFASFALDGVETFCRSSFWPDSEIRLSCTERHIFWDIPRLLIKAGGVAREFIPEAYTDTKDSLGAFWDGFRGR
ncbi:MAG TPA: hypothetical protein ENH99_01700 [Candidatus Pacearchaeota archaeon]|nr:hypothetical protein [Candidatus Pacearchaeota archaeon]